MSLSIKDGTGKGYTAKVNKRNKLEVEAAIFSESRLVAKDDAETYLWTSSFSANTGEEVIYVKNTSKTKVLIIDKVTVNGVLTGLFELHIATGTVGGTVITGANSNLTSGNVADATSYGDAAVTGLTIGNRIDLARIPANGRATMELNDVLILGQNNAITVTYTGSTSIVDLIVTGYYQDA